MHDRTALLSTEQARNMLQRRVAAAVCKNLRTDAFAISRGLECQEFGGCGSKSAFSTKAAGVEMRDFKERLRPLGPGTVDLCLDDDKGLATLVLDNPERCNGERTGRESSNCNIT